MTDSSHFALDPMQQRWRSQDARLDRALAVNDRALRMLAGGQVRGALGRVSRTLWIECALNAVPVLLLGGFIGNRLEALRGEARFLVPAAVLLAASIALLAAIVVQLVRLAAIDPAEPVSTTQRKLEELHVLRIRVTTAVILFGIAMWLPIAIVLLRAWPGIDLYALLPGRYLLANLAFGLALVPLTRWLSRAYGARISANPALRRIVDDLAGRSMNDARAKLAGLAAFAREDDAFEPPADCTLLP